jgi:ABC-2 type transport system permease protein
LYRNGEVPGVSGIAAKLRRIRALMRKEGYQILRDPSSIALGVVMPVMLILLFGFGLSLDVKNVPVALVVEHPSPVTASAISGFRLSPYFDAHVMTSMNEAEQLMLARKVDGIIVLQSDFARKLGTGNAQVKVLVHGADANRARIIEAYAEGAIGQYAVHQSAEGRTVAGGPVGIESRLWFNEANDSHYYLVPGLIVLVMTLIGSFLTTMVVAREWERGTLEALFVTPMRTDEFLLGKTLPYFFMGMLGLMLCFLASQFMFGVPFRGSVWLFVGISTLYLLIALGIGLLISSAVKSQFVASQLTMVVTFLPAMMLSGFIFDLRSMPVAVRAITYMLPARYFVALLQTVFLAGNVWSVILPDSAVLAGMVIVLLLLSRRATRKKLA